MPRNAVESISLFVHYTPVLLGGRPGTQRQTDGLLVKGRTVNAAMVV
jgi:hypothetical protein